MHSATHTTTTTNHPHSSAAPVLTDVRCDGSNGIVHVAWSDGCNAEFDPTWLRHHAPGARLASGQSLIDPADLPTNLLVTDHVINEHDEAVLSWSDCFGPAAIKGAWLRQHIKADKTEQAIEFWHEPPGDRLPRADYQAWRNNDAVLLDWLAGYERYGVALLHGVPAQEQALEQVAGRFGLVLETNYGRVFSVKTKAEPENLADSSFGLPLHTDNPYRQPPPGAQLLHCMRADNEGGESLFADGFAAAQRLARQEPGAYAILTHTPVRFRYETADTLLEAVAPMIELDSTGTVRSVRFNSRSMMPAAQPARDVDEFYAAYRAFHAQLHAPSAVLRIKLNAGDLVLMDNRRLLHGRGAFTQGGDRHLRGCYMQSDSILSRLAVLRRDAPKQTGSSPKVPA